MWEIIPPKKVHGVIEYIEKQFQKYFSLYALVASTFWAKQLASWLCRHLKSLYDLAAKIFENSMTGKGQRNPHNNSRGVRSRDLGGHSPFEIVLSLKNSFCCYLVIWCAAPSCWIQQSCSWSGSKEQNCIIMNLYASASTGSSKMMVHWALKYHISLKVQF
jgi:hypothetical protein